jgi:hypothetical protein
MNLAFVNKAGQTEADGRDRNQEDTDNGEHDHDAMLSPIATMPRQM